MTGPGDSSALRIVVVRSGGFAGIRREWRVEAADGAGDWEPLVAACPWDAATADATSRDRFVWRIEVRISRRRRVASVPDRDLTGPWRELVDRVQLHSDDADAVDRG